MESIKRYKYNLSVATANFIATIRSNSYGMIYSEFMKRTLKSFQNLANFDPNHYYEVGYINYLLAQNNLKNALMETKR